MILVKILTLFTFYYFREVNGQKQKYKYLTKEHFSNIHLGKILFENDTINIHIFSTLEIIFNKDIIQTANVFKNDLLTTRPAG
jgi:hypothetical protein